MDRTRRLTGAEPSRVMQRQERKSYREEDSLLLYDSNVAAAPARHNVQDRQSSLEDANMLTEHAPFLGQRQGAIMNQSRSTKNLGLSRQ